MTELVEWPYLIILAANTVGLIVTVLWALRESSMRFLFIISSFYGGVILLNVIYPGREFSGVIGYITSVIAFFVLVGYIGSIKEDRELSVNDRAVVDDFRKWAGGGGIGEKKTVSGFGAYASRDKEMHRDTGAPSLDKDPVCSNCGTVYNREVVVSLIKQRSPEIFDFQTWTTKFVCKTCREEIVISGSGKV